MQSVAGLGGEALASTIPRCTSLHRDALLAAIGLVDSREVRDGVCRELVGELLADGRTSEARAVSRLIRDPKLEFATAIQTGAVAADEADEAWAGIDAIDDAGTRLDAMLEVLVNAGPSGREQRVAELLAFCRGTRGSGRDDALFAALEILVGLGCHGSAAEIAALVDGAIPRDRGWAAIALAAAGAGDAETAWSAACSVERRLDRMECIGRALGVLEESKARQLLARAIDLSAARAARRVEELAALCAALPDELRAEVVVEIRRTVAEPDDELARVNCVRSRRGSSLAREQVTKTLAPRPRMHDPDRIGQLLFSAAVEPAHHGSPAAVALLSRLSMKDERVPLAEVIAPLLAESSSAESLKALDALDAADRDALRRPRGAPRDAWRARDRAGGRRDAAGARACRPGLRAAVPLARALGPEAAGVLERVLVGEMRIDATLALIDALPPGEVPRETLQAALTEVRRIDDLDARVSALAELANATRHAAGSTAVDVVIAAIGDPSVRARVLFVAGQQLAGEHARDSFIASAELVLREPERHEPSFVDDLAAELQDTAPRLAAGLSAVIVDPVLRARGILRALPALPADDKSPWLETVAAAAREIENPGTRNAVRYDLSLELATAVGADAAIELLREIDDDDVREDTTALANCLLASGDVEGAWRAAGLDPEVQRSALTRLGVIAAMTPEERPLGAHARARNAARRARRAAPGRGE